MSRQIDVKALVSHIVRGDGADKCRICMGDTSEGQVHLGDTVMLDGDTPVTLAELLETITGVEVEEENGMPRGICKNCSEDTLAAVQFRQLCNESVHQWTQAVDSLDQIYDPTDADKAYFVFYNNGEETIVRDQVERIPSKEKALERLNSSFQDNSKSPEKIKKFRKTHKGSVKHSKCPDCGKEFSMPYYFNVHLKNSMKRVCIDCGVVLTRDKLGKHLAKVHNRHLYDCYVCHKLFNDESTLIYHCKTVHGENAYMCQVCGNGFLNERALRAHTYSHALFNCLSCNATFENRKCYKYHSKKCKSVDRPTENVFICDYCNHQYDKKPSLKIHIIQKHLNVLPYQCATCGKRTSTVAHLRSHEKVHETQRKIYECHCGAKMRTEHGFQLHLRIHSGLKPYECSECGDRFLSASRRLDHIKRRHRSAKDMPHGCDICSARFVRPFELRKHCKTVHNTTVNVLPVVKRYRQKT